MKKRKGVERQRAWRARGKKDIAEEGNVSEDLSEARIANCYYPGDNKTVTIFADGERGKHERARRRTERTAWRGPKSARGEADRKGWREDRQRGTRAADRRRGGRTDAAAPFTLEQEKKRIKRERGRLGTKKRTCQVASTLRPPSTPFDTLRLSSPSLPSPCLAPSYLLSPTLVRRLLPLLLLL